MDRYDFDTYIRPLWQGGAIENETVFPLEDADGRVPLIPLLYRASRIREVRTSDLETLFVQGKDYALEDGCLRILPGGSIPTVAHDKFFFAEKPTECASFSCSLGGYIYFSEGSGMHDLQLAVSYDAEDDWRGPVPAAKGALLPATLQKLKDHEHLRVLVYGDSISTGCNSSGNVGSKPGAVPWFDQFIRGLKARAGYDDIELVNTAVGGTTSQWGVENVQTLAAEHKPDLAIIAFGMNDGSGKRPVGRFAENIRTIRDCIARANPACEFILIATMIPHALVKGFFGYQEAYLPALCKLEGPGCAVADVTSIHKYCVHKKRYFDMSGNNVNHPNDFAARIYSQVLLRLTEE